MLDQEASGDSWDNPDSVYQELARMCRQGIYYKGEMPVRADERRGKYKAAKAVLARH